MAPSWVMSQKESINAFLLLIFTIVFVKRPITGIRGCHCPLISPFLSTRAFLLDCPLFFLYFHRFNVLFSIIYSSLDGQACVATNRSMQQPVITFFIDYRTPTFIFHRLSSCRSFYPKWVYDATLSFK